MTTRRLLIVMRHANAEPFAASDHERRLTERGEAGATTAGAFLQAIGAVPGHVVVSTSVRTRETWDLVAAASGSQADPVFDETLYLGGPDAAIESLRSVPTEARTVLFVGHNPTTSDLSHLLHDGQGDPAAVSAMLHGFPPGATAVFEVSCEWHELGPECCQLLGFHPDER